MGSNDPKRLTLQERLQVACYHSSGPKTGNWVVDSTHGHGVCCYCGKPAPELVLRICFECGTEFVLNFGPDWMAKNFVHKGKVYEREFYCPPCY